VHGHARHHRRVTGRIYYHRPAHALRSPGVRVSECPSVSQRRDAEARRHARGGERAAGRIISIVQARLRFRALLIDLDIVACALVSSKDVETRSLPAVVWLEQTRPGLSTGTCWKSGCRRTPRWMPEIMTTTVTWTSSSGTSCSTHRQGLVEIFENLRVTAVAR
jgi:hypothetical protein